MRRALHPARQAYARTQPAAEPDWTLLSRFLPLVKAIVARMRIYFPPQAEVEDLYSVGVTGLVTAIHRCDPEKTASFASYAALRIRGAILDELRRLDWMPRASRMRAKSLRKKIEELEQSLGRPATEAEAAEAMELDLPAYRALLDQVRPVSLVSLDSSLNPREPERTSVHEVVSDDTEMNARERCEKREVVELMREHLRKLPEMPRKVLVMYYYEGMRLAEIAEVFSLTESRICQIHAQAVISLRGLLDRATRG